MSERERERESVLCVLNSSVVAIEAVIFRVVHDSAVLLLCCYATLSIMALLLDILVTTRCHCYIHTYVCIAHVNVCVFACIVAFLSIE